MTSATFSNVFEYSMRIGKSNKAGHLIVEKKSVHKNMWIDFTRNTNPAFLAMAFLLLATGWSITTSFQKNGMFASAGIATIGYRFSLEKPSNETPNLKSFSNYSEPHPM